MPETPKVLIVDDEARFCRSIIKFLSIHKITAAAALNGEAAMEALVEQACDVVVLDIKMPGIGGIELMKWISPLKVTLV